jgi:hypothetical protein
MKNLIKVIEIVFAGSYSVRGAICETLKDKEEMKDFGWVICTNIESFEMIKQECEELALTDYIIVDRKSMVVKGNQWL